MKLDGLDEAITSLESAFALAVEVSHGEVSAIPKQTSCSSGVHTILFGLEATPDPFLFQDTGRRKIVLVLDQDQHASRHRA